MVGSTILELNAPPFMEFPVGGRLIEDSKQGTPPWFSVVEPKIFFCR